MANTTSSSKRMVLRLPKGTKDYAGDDYHKMEFLKAKARSVFALYGGEYLETPTFELTDVLTNKYGEDEKLIYNLECKSENVQVDNHELNSHEPNSHELNSYEPNLRDSMFKEQLSLRYDLTVPLVRYCIMNRVDKMKRCTIGKVYRREATSATNKRLREFHQADFDFVGDFGELLPELSIFAMVQKFFTEIGVEDYQIIYNYRQILNFCVEKAQIDKEMFSTVCSSIDKLDKHDETYVKSELSQKGLTNDQINTLFEALSNESVVPSDVKIFDDKFQSCLSNMTNIDYTKIKLDRTLARGSDYYTGIIFEVKLTTGEMKSSVSGGGRYDELIPSYMASVSTSTSTKQSKKQAKIKSFPMIGFSFGLDRLVDYIKPELLTKNTKRSIWVATIGKNFELNGESIDPLILKIRTVSILQKAGISVLYNTNNRKFNKEIRDADDAKCRYVLIIGEKEYSDNKFKVKDMDARTELEYSFDEIDRIIELF